eukprot:1142302-Pelagomonas_calceolata.AAC.12
MVSCQLFQTQPCAHAINFCALQSLLVILITKDHHSCKPFPFLLLSSPVLAQNLGLLNGASTLSASLASMLACLRGTCLTIAARMKMFFHACLLEGMCPTTAACMWVCWLLALNWLSTLSASLGSSSYRSLFVKAFRAAAIAKATDERPSAILRLTRGKLYGWKPA